MFSAIVIEDSIASNGVRLTSLQLEYPRFIHSELLTHRDFSRGSASSRAIPVAKLLEQVRNNPAMPVHWGKNQAGMQAKAELPPSLIVSAKNVWADAATAAAYYAELLSQGIGLHKQVANRLLEPFVWMKVIVTATEWANFFELRDHPDAQPEFYHLVHDHIRSAMNDSTPTFRPRERGHHSAWHLPYIAPEERTSIGDPRLLAKLSAARCARVSYMNHDNKRPGQDEDLALYERLVGQRPLHAGPIEHQAYPLPLATQRCKNFQGWRQHRDLVEIEAAGMKALKADALAKLETVK